VVNGSVHYVCNGSPSCLILSTLGTG
jgi:hypothetical protein